MKTSPLLSALFTLSALAGCYESDSMTTEVADMTATRPGPAMPVSRQLTNLFSATGTSLAGSINCVSSTGSKSWIYGPDGSLIISLKDESLALCDKEGSTSQFTCIYQSKPIELSSNELQTPVWSLEFDAQLEAASSGPGRRYNMASLGLSRPGPDVGGSFFLSNFSDSNIGINTIASGSARLTGKAGAINQQSIIVSLSSYCYNDASTGGSAKTIPPAKFTLKSLRLVPVTN